MKARTKLATKSVEKKKVLAVSDTIQFWCIIFVGEYWSIQNGVGNVLAYLCLGRMALSSGKYFVSSHPITFPNPQLATELNNLLLGIRQLVLRQLSDASGGNR